MRESGLQYICLSIHDMRTKKAACIVYKLPGMVEYASSWRQQKALMGFLTEARKVAAAEAVMAGAATADTTHRLIVTQHSSVYTLGRGSSLENLKFDALASESSKNVVRVERGGEVTWHGPGQLVAYPIFDLTCAPFKKDLHWFMHALEETVMHALKSGFDVDSGRNDVNNGVWVGQNKIAAVGVTASRWVTMHGLALNVHPDMASYDHIVPCGISEPGFGVTSLKQVLYDGANGGGGSGGGGGGSGGGDGGSGGGGGAAVAAGDIHMKAATETDMMDTAAARLVQSFGEVFNMDMHYSQAPGLELDTIADNNPTRDTLLPLER
jgi:lipoyl(octanoyl) transferase